MDMPLVLVDNNIVEPKVPCVMTDNMAGAREAVEHLIGLGHEEIRVRSGPMTHSSFMKVSRLQARPWRQMPFQSGRRWSLPTRMWPITTSMEDRGGRLLKRSPRPTAIFAANDSMAIGVMKAAQEIGLAVPDDVSVIGFDDIELAAPTTPPTTVRVQKGTGLSCSPPSPGIDRRRPRPRPLQDHGLH